jgi:hypothetical protein
VHPDNGKWDSARPRSEDWARRAESLLRPESSNGAATDHAGAAGLAVAYALIAIYWEIRQGDVMRGRKSTLSWARYGPTSTTRATEPGA